MENSQEIKLFDIFKVFLKIGLILLGGGYVIVPIMKEELNIKNNWLTEDEICDYYCVSQCLSGIIALNMAILTGYKLRKFKGALTSVFAMSLTPFLSIITVALLIEKIMKISFIESIFWGVNISVIVLIYLTLKDMWTKSIVDFKTSLWFLFILILSISKISPVFLIIFSIIFGLILQFIEDKKNA